MSGVFSLFGKKKKKAAKPKYNPEATLQAISKLDKTSSQLEKRAELLQKRCANFARTAKAKLKRGDKKGALFALKQKKMYEKQVTNLENSVLRLYEQKMALEASSLQKTVVDTMSAGSKAMSNIHKNMDIDSVDDMRDDIQESMDKADEINDAIATPFGDAMEDDEFDDELAELMMDDDPIEEAATTTPFLPEAPQQIPVLPDPVVGTPATKAPVVAADPDAGELDELEAMM